MYALVGNSVVKLPSRRSLVGLVASLICMMIRADAVFAGTVADRAHQCRSASAIRTDEEGVATVSFTITTEGTVSDPEILTSSGYADLDAASVDCVRAWRYYPKIENGKPVLQRWTAGIAWNPTVPPLITLLVQDCAKSVSSEHKEAAGVSSFAITFENFKIVAVSLVRSGGDKIVDEAEASCLSNTKTDLIERAVVNNRVDYSRQVTVNVDMALKGVPDGAEAR